MSARPLPELLARAGIDVAEMNPSDTNISSGFNRRSPTSAVW